MDIELPPETTRDLVYSIQRYFLEQRGAEIGELQAGFFLEFVLKEIGPSVYNQAIRDAQVRLHTIVADLDVTLHVPEFGHSNPPR